MSQTQNKPSISELEKAAAQAQKAYEDAAAALAEALKDMNAALSSDAPHNVKAVAASAAAKAAATDKATADATLADARTAFDNLPADATEERVTAAEQAVTDAETAQKAAEEAKKTADEEATKANTAADDLRVSAVRRYSVAKTAAADALAAKEAADKALADARKEQEEQEEEGGEDDCVAESRLTTVVTGLPSKIVAGTTTTFKLRVTNGTDKTLDEVLPYAGVHALDADTFKDIDALLRLQWSSAASGQWKNLDRDHYAGSIKSLKPGAHADVKLRLTVDASAPAAGGVAFVAGDYINKNGSCGGTPDIETYEFEIKAKGSTPGKVEDAPSTSEPGNTDVLPQGGAVPISAANTATGTLAATGSSSATSGIALAGGAALVIGAGAVFIGRRRKADTGA
ncbi:LPXTG cell wall anchor domain-containing protein [Streptomyces sp. DT24]|uniref:LPXTG cell wall anchor domain-containing protein n=1 Tax=Streptomyces sp. DT24 TaxID=3416520 RepID=UPI003CF9498D